MSYDLLLALDISQSSMSSTDHHSRFTPSPRSSPGHSSENLANTSASSIQATSVQDDAFIILWSVAADLYIKTKDLHHGTFRLLVVVVVVSNFSFFLPLSLLTTKPLNALRRPTPTSPKPPTWYPFHLWCTTR